jgi:hypothetical protein
MTKVLDRLVHRPSTEPEHNPHLRVVVTEVRRGDERRDEEHRPEPVVGEVEAATQSVAAWAAGVLAYRYTPEAGYRVKVLPGGAR